MSRTTGAGRSPDPSGTNAPWLAPRGISVSVVEVVGAYSKSPDLGKQIEPVLELAGKERNGQKTVIRLTEPTSWNVA